MPIVHTRIPHLSRRQVVVFRGLRLKCGLDCGKLQGEINGITGRMSYRCGERGRGLKAVGEGEEEGDGAEQGSRGLQVDISARRLHWRGDMHSGRG